MKPSTYEDSYTGGGASINHRQQLYRGQGEYVWPKLICNKYCLKWDTDVKFLVCPSVSGHQKKNCAEAKRPVGEEC